MKDFCKIAAQSIVSLVMIFSSVSFLQRIEETVGWASVGLFLNGAVLFGAGFFIFCKLDKALSRM